MNGKPGNQIPSAAPSIQLLSGVLLRIVEVVLAAFADVVDGRADVLAAVRGVAGGDVPEHLDAEAAVQVLHDAALPGAADDLRGQPADGPRLGHDVVGDREAAADQLRAWYDLVDQAVL